jgi:hypothetical protein
LPRTELSESFLPHLSPSLVQSNKSEPIQSLKKVQTSKNGRYLFLFNLLLIKKEDEESGKGNLFIDVIHLDNSSCHFTRPI